MSKKPEYVQLDRSTWVRPEAVQMVRMGFDHETLIYLDDDPFTVDRSITETLALLSGEADD